MSTKGLNMACLGKTYTGETVVALKSFMEAYARAVGDVDGAYVDLEREGGIVAHPVFPVLLLRGLMPAVLEDPELNCDMQRLVHGEQAFNYLQPIRPGDPVQLEGTIIDIEDKSTGQVLRAEQRLIVGGEIAVRGMAGAFVRGSGPCLAKPERGSAQRPRPRRHRPHGVQLTYAETALVDADQAKRYAKASGDYNPIHLNPEVAKAAGLPDVILQGTCTMAFAARALVKVLKGQPERLQSLSVRFTKPVMLPDRVTVEIWKPREGVLHFEAKNQAGETVLSRGIADVTE